MTDLQTEVTTCKLCGEKFRGSRIAIVAKPDAKLQGLLTQVGAHLQTKHPNESHACAIAGVGYMGMLALMNLASTDEDFLKKQDQARWEVHQQTLAVRITDEMLNGRVVAISRAFSDLMLSWDGSNPTDFNTIHEMIVVRLLAEFTALRDKLEEPGKYPVPQTVVTH